MTPSTRTLWSSPAMCRVTPAHWTSGVLAIEGGDMCPVNQYIYSGFVALQTIIDHTKIMVISIIFRIN